MKSITHHVLAVYHFFPLKDLELIKSTLETKALEWGIRGIFILGPDGINSTCAAPSLESRDLWKEFLGSYFQVTDLEFKDSLSFKPPFRRFSVKIRSEIVTAGRPDLIPTQQDNHHLTPEEWNRVMKEESDYVLVDTRNWYEYEMGTFKGAINPQTSKFTDFFDQVDQLKLPKDKKMLVFCTGGIRCHKGILELQDRGYSNVFQLKGGILKYLEEYPNDQFDGDCFVFDHRVAVDQNLLPTQNYGLCPHCGNPAKVKITCVRCDHQTLICETCSEEPQRKITCSKNCRYHYALHPDRKVKRRENSEEEDPRKKEMKNRGDQCC